MDIEREKIEEQLKKALVKLKMAKETIDSLRQSSNEPIAIIGMACRYPGNVSTPEEFWDLLKEGRDAIIEIPESRWNVDDYYDSDKEAPGKMYTRSGGFLQQAVDQFDNDFFNISPREARDMDPQQRLLLEVCYEALENAAIPSNDIKGSDTGMFMGIMYNDYFRLLDQTNNNNEITAYYDTGNLFSATIGRLSYYLGIHGPCIPIDTACSSSLVAIELACQSLRSRQSKLALAGGVNLTLKPESMVMECKANMLSPDGRCKTFDASADGFSHSEGCGVVVLKRLSDAQKDHDHILAVIRGGATNHGGASSGLTVPNQLAEEALMRTALQNASLKPNEIDYIEAHGTGTALGDPIEVAAIASVYGGGRNPEKPLILGSVKTNIGHAESAAGVAGLMKVILSFQNETIPAHLHLNKLNPLIELESIPAKISSKTIPWEKKDGPRRAAISSFGFSGINSHLILEEAPTLETKPGEQEESSLHILTLSAKTGAALDALIGKYKLFKNSEGASFADIAYTTNIGRNHERCRMAVVAKDLEELQSKMSKGDFFRDEVGEIKIFEIPEISRNAWESFLRELAQAYVKGAEIDWKKISGLHARKVSLPMYPFQRKSFWHDFNQKTYGRELLINPLLGAQVQSAGDDLIFEQIISLEDFSYLSDHVIYDSIILPGAGFIELMLAALYYLVGGACQLKDVRIEKPFFLDPKKEYRVQVVAKKNEEVWSFSIYSKEYSESEGPWICHALGLSDVSEKIQPPETISLKRLQNITDIINAQTSVPDYYDVFWKIGYRYGAYFRGLKGIIQENDVHWAYIVAPENLSLEKYLFHPALLDAAFHALLAASLEIFKENPFLPISVDKIISYMPLSSKVWVKVISKASSSSEILTYDCILYNELGECCASIIGMTLKKSTKENLIKLLQEEKNEISWFYNIVLEPQELSKNKAIKKEIPYLLLSSSMDIAVGIETLKENAEFIVVDIDKMVSEEVGETFNNQKYSGIIVLINHFESRSPTTPDLKASGIIFFLSLAQLMRNHPEIPIFIVNVNNPLSGFMYASFCRCWRLEETERTIKYIQVNEAFSDLSFIPEEIATEDLETEVFYQDHDRFVSRLAHLTKDLSFQNGLLFLPEATYLITGGLGGLGMALAKWCVNRGAKRLILLGRSAPNEQALRNIEELISKGAVVDFQSIDISSADQIKALISKINQKSHPLKGIFHLAGIVEQGFISDQTPELFEKVFAPKALGAWHLHEATQALDLDYFVLFSSISAAMGAPGSSNYAVANAFLDALAHARRTNGLPAYSLQWGPWEEVGMMTKLSESKQIPGLIRMLPESALEAMEKILQGKQAPNLLIANIQWSDIPKRLPTQVLWKSFIPKQKEVIGQLTNRLLDLDSDERLEYLKLFLRKILQDILKLEDISPALDERGFFELGLDSLMSTTLYQRLKESLGEEYKLAYTLAYDYPSINELSLYLTQVLGLNEKLKSTKKSVKTDSETDKVAVIGMACRFPGGANSPEEFWDILAQSKDVHSLIPKERWDVNLYYDPDREKAGKMYAESGHFLNIPIDQFDPEFFHISSREANFIDPQQRLLMELSWEVFENAGIDPFSLKGSQTGVFVGLMTQDYYSLFAHRASLNEINKFSIVGADFLGGPGRLSYFYGFRGPSVPVITACSSSLVATHLGVISLLRGESDLALAGGVNVILDPSYMIGLSKMGLLSPDGLSKTFDKRADGYGRGEGVGFVLLKRLSDALRDKDNILGVIHGTAVNHNGPASGLTVPSSQAQQELYLTALREAKLSPDKISFIEAHGTGTALGDPIETGSIKEIYGDQNRKNPLWIGAVKSNIGHLEGAAGISSLIKTLLCLQHRKIPPQMHFQELNPKIDLTSIPAKLPAELVNWEGVDQQYFAAVNSFGATGVNAHLIIEAAPAKQESPEKGLELPIQIISISAYSKGALDELCKKYKLYLIRTQNNLTDIAYSTNVSRSQFRYRRAILAADKFDLLAKLETQDWFDSEDNSMAEASLDFEFSKNEKFEIKERSKFKLSIIVGMKDEWEFILGKVAEFFVKGAKIDWKSLYSRSHLSKVDLPHYPFERKRYWVELPKPGPEADSVAAIKTPAERIPSLDHSTVIKDSVNKALRVVLGDSASKVIEAEKNFYEMGLDSLMMVELAQQLHAEYGRKLPITAGTIIEHPSVLELTQYLLEDREPPYYPLSLSQQRFWNEFSQIENKSYCNVDVYYSILGKLDTLLLIKAIKDVIKLHSILGVSFSAKEGVVQQKYTSLDDFEVQREDLSGLDEDRLKLEPNAYIKKMRLSPIDMNKDRLFRIHLLKFSENKHILGFEFNHIISDAVCVVFLVKQVFDHYWALQSGGSSNLEPPKKQFQDFVQWEQDLLESHAFEEDLRYLTNCLALSHDDLNLPHKTISDQEPYQESIIHFEINKKITENIIKISRKNKVSFFCCLLALFNISIYKISKDTDINVAIPLIRKPLDFKGTFGFFVNTIIARTQLDENKNFIDILKVTEKVLSDSLKRQDVPFEKLKSALETNQLVTSNSFFNLSFSLLSAADMHFQVGDLLVDCVDTYSGYPEFNITHQPGAIKIDMYQDREILMGILKYNASYYSKESINTLINSFQRVCQLYSSEPDARLINS